MARSTFGGYGGDQVSLDPAGNSGFYKAAANYNATGTFWSASTGGTQYTDLIDPVTSVALAGVSTDAHGHVVPFKGPDGITEGWVDFGAGRFKITATDAGVFQTSTGMDTAVNALITTAGTATRGSLDGRYVGQSQMAMDLAKQTGVDNTGVTECAAAINTALSSAASLGLRVFGRGTYNTASTVTIQGNADLRDATFNYTGTSVAVQVGSGNANWRYRVMLPTVSYANKPTTGWTAGTVGVRCYNTMQCDITSPMITGFESGLQMYADGGNGCVYNTVAVGSLANNKRNLHLTAVSNGYVNQNTFIGGGYSHYSSEGTNVSGTRHILLDHLTGTSADPNNNLWLNPSMESPTVVEYVLDVAGTFNMWVNGRFEFTAGSPKVRWNSTAVRNQILYGNNADAIAETWVAGAGYNTVLGTSSARFTSASSQGYVFENDGSSAFAGITLMAAGAAAAGTSQATGYTSRFEASKWRGKNAADTLDRYSVDAAGRTITYGAGSSAPLVTLTWFTGAPEAVITANVGSEYIDYTSGVRWRKASGTGNTGWAPVIGHALLAKTASYTLASGDDLVTFNGASLTATLPDPTTVIIGRRYTVKNLNASALTVNSAGTSKTLDGAASVSLAQWAVGKYLSDGTQWLTV